MSKSTTENADKEPLLKRPTATNSASMSATTNADDKSTSGPLRSVQRSSVDSTKSGSRQVRIISGPVTAKGPKREDASIYNWTASYAMYMISYLLILYLILAVYATIIMTPVLYFGYKKPFYFGEGSFIGGTPQLLFEPNPDAIVEKTRGVLNFQSDKLSTFTKYLSRIKMFRSTYAVEPSSNCSSQRMMQLDGKYTAEVCPALNHSSEDPYLGLGPCNLNTETIDAVSYNLGYSVLRPCVAVSLTKMLGVYPSNIDEARINYDSVPETYVVQEEFLFGTRNFTLENAKADIQQQVTEKCNGDEENCCETFRFGVFCEAPGHKDVSITQFPLLGAPFCPLPFWSQAGFQPPFVMLQISDIPENKEVKIRCTSKLKEWQTLPTGEPNHVEFSFFIGAMPE